MGLFVRKQTTGMEKSLYSVGMNKTALIVGLGNVGKEYDLTRHNVGFDCLDYFAKTNDFPAWMNKKDLKSHITVLNMGDTRVILCKPTTFMNNSGEAVQAVQNYYKVDAAKTLVLHDEIDIPFGQIRLRQGGGSAGHNGLKSLIGHGNETSTRVRIGIANDFSAKADSADFVLGKFTKEEQADLPTLRLETNSIITEYVFGGSLPAETRSFIL